MFRLALAFGIGWYFGRNRNAGSQVVAAGQQLLDATNGQPVAQPVLPDTNIVSPEKAAGCRDGYTWWPQYGKCLDPALDQKLRYLYESGKPLPKEV